MTDPTPRDPIAVTLSPTELAVIWVALEKEAAALRSALEPFSLVVVWDAEKRLIDTRAVIRAARCDLNRRDPRYNPAGDPQCQDEATDEELDRWHGEHQEPTDD